MIVLGLFIIVCGLAIYLSRKQDWPINQKVGAALFLIGTAIVLFLDAIVTANTEVLSWTEPIGVVVIVAGLLITWFWQPD